MNELESKTPPLELTLDIDAVELPELCRILSATHSLLVRGFLQWLHDRYAKDRSDSSHPRKSLNVFGRSYISFLERKDVPQVPLDHVAKLDPRELMMALHRPYPAHVFEEHFDDQVFDAWVANGLTGCAIVVNAIRPGSLTLVLSYAALAALTTYPVDYSLIKDITLCTLTRLANGLRPWGPKNTLGHVSEVLQALPRDKRVKKFQLKFEKETLDLTIEYWKQ